MPMEDTHTHYVYIYEDMYILVFKLMFTVTGPPMQALHNDVPSTIRCSFFYHYTGHDPFCDNQ